MVETFALTDVPCQGERAITPGDEVEIWKTYRLAGKIGNNSGNEKVRELELGTFPVGIS